MKSATLPTPVAMCYLSLGVVLYLSLAFIPFIAMYYLDWTPPKSTYVEIGYALYASFCLCFFFAPVIIRLSIEQKKVDNAPDWQI